MFFAGNSARFANRGGGVEHRPLTGGSGFIGSHSVVPNWISSPRFCREAAPEAAERPIENFAQRRPERCQQKGQKRQNGHENLEKQQQTWVRGSEVVQSSKLLSGLGASKIGGKEKRLLLIL
jgi:hypothetical protein